MQVTLSAAEPPPVRAAALAFAASCTGLISSLTKADAADMREMAALHRAIDLLLDHLPSLVQVDPSLFACPHCS